MVIIRGAITRMCIVFLVVKLFLGLSYLVAADDLPFSVPQGFSVQRVADDVLAHDCFCMTLDGLGRPIVSGPGYIRTLIDDDGDGTYDRGVQWSTTKQGAQGLWSEGRKLYYVGDGGLWLTEDANGDLAADPNPKKLLELPTGQEHTAHAIRRGPDGYWYLIAGNFATDISKLQNDPLSPISKSRSGTLWRISPDFTKRGVWAHGMRNCYDFDFMPDGQIVTFDSDCERESTLPWYRPTRVMVLGPGSDAGWCGQAWKDEDHRLTMPLVLAQLGRGSPTGVAVYQHSSFGKKYRGAVFVLDWTFGRVIALYPSRNLEESKRIPNKVPAEIFMQPSGTTGFAPTDCCVAPDGSLLVSVGGRGTTGAVYRIQCAERNVSLTAKTWFSESISRGLISEERAESLQRLLTSNSPLDSWSEAKWFPEVEKAGAKSILGVLSGEIPMETDPEVIASAKLRCAQILTRLNVTVPFSKIQNALSSPSHSTRVAAWWLLGRGNVATAANDLKLINSLTSLDYTSLAFNSDPNDRSNWELHLGPADERLRWEAMGIRKWSFNAANSLHCEDSEAGNSLRRTWLWALARSGAPLSKKSEDNAIDVLIAKQLYATTKSEIDSPLLDVMASWVPKNQPKWSTRDTLEFLTVLQSSLGERRFALPQQQDPPKPDVLDGYKGLGSSKLPENVRTAWVGWVMFIAKQAAQGDKQLVHMEATRTLSMLEPKDAESLRYCLDQIDEKSHPTLDIHALCCSANCQSPRTAELSNRTAKALSAIIHKVKDRGLVTDNQWPNRLQQLVAALLKKDSGLGVAFVDLPVACCAEDLVLLSAFPVDVQVACRKKMKDYLLSTDPSQWAIPILRFATQSGLDNELAKAIRSASNLESLKQVACELLASKPSPEDQELFLSMLDRSDRNLWPSAWKGLSALPVQDAKREWPILVVVASAVINTSSSLPRAAVLKRVRSLASELRLENPPDEEQWPAWESYFRSNLNSDLISKLIPPQSNFDWHKLHDAANAISGDTKKGQLLFQEKCVLCHGGQSSLGPSLVGVAKRFSRDDLAKAIFEPSRDISDRYKSIRILTVDGEIFTGMVVYTAADGTTMQTATGAIIRINQENIEDKAYATESLMPSGLLDEKSAEQVADLYAYLGTL